MGFLNCYIEVSFRTFYVLLLSYLVTIIYTTFRPVLGLIEPPIQLVPGEISPE
jgi:hypothetical protein